MNPSEWFCNFCGKSSEDPGMLNAQEFRIRFTYGSKRDGTNARFCLCTKCLDQLYDQLVEQCKIAPEAWELF